MSPSADLETTFKHVVREIADVMKGHGFRKNRLNFSRRCDGGWVVADVQRSQFNDQNELRFAVNLGATADLLGRASADTAPKPHGCDWSARVPTGRRSDTSFWTIKSGTDAERLARDVRKALERHGLPMLDDVAGAAALRDHWLERVDDLATPVGELATLVEALGPKDRVGALREESERRRAQREAHAAEHD